MEKPKNVKKIEKPKNVAKRLKIVEKHSKI